MVQKIHPKGPPWVLPKFEICSMQFHGVFRPFLQRSLSKDTIHQLRLYKAQMTLGSKGLRDREGGSSS